MRSVEESLQRLGLDHIDILHVHDPDDHGEEALSGAFKALGPAPIDRTIRAVGAGMNQAEMLARFAREADFDCFLPAGRYTLLDQAAFAGAVAALFGARHRHHPGRRVQALGIVGNLDDPARATFNSRPRCTGSTRPARFGRSAKEFGTPIQAAALQFPFAHPVLQRS